MESWHNIVKLNTINSTNDYTSNILNREKLPEGSIIFTPNQTNGKGLAFNKWESEAFKNITLSLVLYPNFLHVASQFQLSKAISLGIVDYCNRYSEDIQIKWPNDIYYQEKKLAGILIENTIKGFNIERSIVGIGFNLNQELFVSDAPNPVSLKQITNKLFDVEDEILLLRESIKKYYTRLQSNPNSLDQEYLSKLYRFNEFRKYKVDNKLVEAKIIGVNEFGYLQTIFTDGQKKEFDLKEIEFVL